jgi:hypothetical protein
MRHVTCSSRATQLRSTCTHRGLDCAWGRVAECQSLMAYIWVIAHIWMSHNTHMNEAYHMHHLRPNCDLRELIENWIVCGVKWQHITGWRKLTGCLKLYVIFRKKATDYRALLRKMTYGDKASCDPTPPCNPSWRIYESWRTHERVVPHVYHLQLNCNLRANRTLDFGCNRVAECQSLMVYIWGTEYTWICHAMGWLQLVGSLKS